jgi:hypothetical protein
MFKTAKDFKNYIKQTLKSKGACSAPSQAAIWQVYRGKKFHSVANTYLPNNDGFPLEGTGIVSWKYNKQPKINDHKFCAFYLGYEDKNLNKNVETFLHFEYNNDGIYNVGVELTKIDISSVFNWALCDNNIIPIIFNIF